MALTIRLTRIGSTHQPLYRVAVTEKRSRRDGAAVEQIGHYNPRAKGNQITLDVVRFEHWISKGAQPSDTVKSLYKKAKRAAAGATVAPAA
jgi:small subunit ribosomal protein S16